MTSVRQVSGNKMKMVLCWQCVGSYRQLIYLQRASVARWRQYSEYVARPAWTIIASVVLLLVLQQATENKKLSQTKSRSETKLKKSVHCSNCLYLSCSILWCFFFFLSSPVSSELSGLCYCSVLPQLYQVISIRLMHLSIKFLLLVAGIGRATCCSIYGELHWSTFM